MYLRKLTAACSDATLAPWAYTARALLRCPSGSLWHLPLGSWRIARSEQRLLGGPLLAPACFPGPPAGVHPLKLHCKSFRCATLPVTYLFLQTCAVFSPKSKKTKKREGGGGYLRYGPGASLTEQT